MLVELCVRDVGVIDALDLEFTRGLVAVTGETGAGKTLVVDAIDALLGGRVDPVWVRPGAEAARVTGRFDLSPSAGGEVVVERLVPRVGRSRGYIDGRPAAVGALVELGATLVDLHGQHAHQSLLSSAVQRESLDRFGGVDVSGLRAARARRAEAAKALAALGGDERERVRELDIARFQLRELDDAHVESADEDDRLAAEEVLLGRADEHRRALDEAYRRLKADGAALDDLRAAGTALVGFPSLHARVAGAVAELDDAADAVREVREQLDADPDRLGKIRERRHTLRQLRRKYGDTLAEVLTFADELRRRVAEIENREQLVADAEQLLKSTTRDEEVAAESVRQEREGCAPRLAAAIEAHLPELALARARMRVSVGGVAGEDVVFEFAANAGEPFAPLAKVASGGELARVMLATRLVLAQGPPVLVFDEVDAGIGGEAGRALGAALARLARTHQVFVVTHLAQVAAFADQHWALEKHEHQGRTVTRARAVHGEDRVTELARMLSGTPESSASRQHAAELLRTATVS